MTINSVRTLILCLLLGFSTGAVQADFDLVPVFQNGKQGYNNFRIPSLIVAANGDLLAFCEAREGGDASEIDLVLKRSSDTGKTWGPIEIVQESDHFRGLVEDEKSEITVGNPAPVVDLLDPEHPGRIWLPFTVENDRVFVTFSDDHGKTWAPRREITVDVKKKTWGWYATGPVHSIQIQRGKYRGRLVVPCDHRIGEGGTDRGANGAHAILSDDHGETWRLGAIDDTYDDGLNANETTVVELNDGRLYFNTRNQKGKAKGTRGGVYSSDGGESFDRSPQKAYVYFRPSPDELDPPVVQCSLLRAASTLEGDERNLILFCGPDENGPTGKGRSDLRIRFTTDETQSWQDGPLIHEGPAAYSDLIRLAKGRYGILFEAGSKDKQRYDQIVFTRLEDEDIFAVASEANSADQALSTTRPNVLFIAVDDMKDWVNCLGGYEGVVHTPCIDRLAQRGVLFTNAHCPSPKCAPSRAAIMTGLRPSTTGLYDNGHWWLPNLPEVVTIPMNFRNHGYRVVGAGKVFHHTAGNHPPNQWDDFQRLDFREDPWFRGHELNYPWSKHKPYPKEFPFSGVKGLGHENDWGSLEIPDHAYDDARTINYVVDFLQSHEKADLASSALPFFLACGLFRPHLPWYVPQKYFDMYSADDIVLPTVREDDLSDLPPEGLAFASARRSDFETISNAGKWKQAVRAYLASITCADARIGRVVDALDRSPHADNTIIVFWSDHGWHLGEKQHWHKTTLWEEATRVPLIISAPGHPSGVCDAPVSLLDLYPTLNELCGLASHESSSKDHLTDVAQSNLDGVSLVSLLRDPKSKSSRPAVIEYQKGNAAVRSDRYRYIRYHNGGEELYDHQSDPHEWNNLASDSDYAAKKKKLAGWISKRWADSAPTKAAFHFDPKNFTWTHKTTGHITHGNE
tara:strand:+ start:414635 stop:417367 length:2733 start_codon:yes stop_codon:yes gene_type:complete